MSKNIKPLSKNDFWGSVLLIVLFVLGVLIVWNITREKESETPTDSTKKQVVYKYKSVTCPKDVEAYNALRENSNQIATLVEKENMFAKHGRFINLKVILTKNETRHSKIACGYLFVRAGTKEYGSLQEWENLFINPKDHGGHIDVRNDFMNSEHEDFSEYLFLLDDIRYWENRAERAKGNLLVSDWASLLNASETVPFHIAYNSEVPSGFIDELSIIYKCWDPQTGEENNECKLIVTDVTKTQTDTLN
jgi:hypothetical protein